MDIEATTKFLIHSNVDPHPYFVFPIQVTENFVTMYLLKEYCRWELHLAFIPVIVCMAFIMIKRIFLLKTYTTIKNAHSQILFRSRIAIYVASKFIVHVP